MVRAVESTNLEGEAGKRDTRIGGVVMISSQGGNGNDLLVAA